MCTHIHAGSTDGICRWSDASFSGSSSFEWPARDVWRPSHIGSSGAALLVSRQILFEAAFGAVYPEDSRGIAIGDSSHDAGAVARFGQMMHINDFRLNEVTR